MTNSFRFWGVWENPEELYGNSLLIAAFATLELAVEFLKKDSRERFIQEIVVHNGVANINLRGEITNG
jgi:hypothetical protein